MTGRLKGKAALVTGGGSGIGAAVVRKLAARGCVVGIHYHTSHDEAAALCREIAESCGEARAFQADLTDESEAGDLVTRFVEAFGRIDVLVNNAGDLVARKPLEEMSLDFFRKVAAINMDTAMLVTRAAIPHMKGDPGASIVNVASLAGRKGGHGGSLAYATAKGAMITWTRALSAELAPLGIRVNAVAPGLILGTRLHATHTTPESAQRTVAGIPLGRAGRPEDVARAVAFLASEYDGFITGATLDINGGVYCA